MHARPLHHHAAAPAPGNTPRGLRAWLLPLVMAVLSLQALAQQDPAAASGTTLDGQPFTLRAADGRVRVLMFWRTDCAVCLSKMPELRANARGWQNRPFDLVLINTDAQRQQAQAYDRLRREVNGTQGPLISAWLGEVQLPAAWWAAPAGGSPAPRLPLMLVIDREGRVAARHEGRVPPALWDQVADLLP
jgi:thiol-disulfide isomerase/thioredoxin